MSKVLILVNHYNTLRVFRKELLVALAGKGHRLIVGMPPADWENEEIIRSYGCELIHTPMERRGLNPVKDFFVFLRYKKLIRQLQPDQVVTYTIKPNIYGALACKQLNVPCFANITGLGSAFDSGGIMRRVVSLLYRISLKRVKRVFFENTGDRDKLVSNGIVSGEQAVVLPGAGVNLNWFFPAPYPPDDKSIRFLFIGRMMREKGIDELFYAIEQPGRRDGLLFEFIGWYEDDYKERVEQFEHRGLIKFHRFEPDVRPYIERAHCIILPSYHEGMSNTLLEAASMCRPVITSDIHGCKEAVVEGESGCLVPVRNAQALLAAIQTVIALPYEQKKSYGLRARAHVEQNFDKKMVVQQTIQWLGL